MAQFTHGIWEAMTRAKSMLKCARSAPWRFHALNNGCAKRIEMQRDPADCVVEDLRLHCISPAGKILVCSMLFPLF